MPLTACPMMDKRRIDNNWSTSKGAGVRSQYEAFMISHSSRQFPSLVCVASVHQPRRARTPYDGAWSVLIVTQRALRPRLSLWHQIVNGNVVYDGGGVNMSGRVAANGTVGFRSSVRQRPRQRLRPAPATREAAAGAAIPAQACVRLLGRPSGAEAAAVRPRIAASFARCVAAIAAGCARRSATLIARRGCVSHRRPVVSLHRVGDR